MFNLISLVARFLTTDTPAPTLALEDKLFGSNYFAAGNEAIVTRTIEPGKAGQVQFQGTWWTARCDRQITLLPGTIVWVIDRRQVTTLYVDSVSPADEGYTYSKAA